MIARLCAEIGTLTAWPTRSQDVLTVGDSVDAARLANECPEVVSGLKTHVAAGKSRVCFVFTRHIGCPCTEATIGEVFHVASAQQDVRFFVVLQGDEKQAQELVDLATKTQGASKENVQLVADPTYILYDIFGVPVTGISHMTASEVQTGLADLKAKGIENTFPTGSRFQSAAVFVVVSTGEAKVSVLAVHLPAHALEMPNLEELLSKA
ncbi:unnamed protein product [Polarella glacialis]|uniref:Alkyl hydroperoxide reductase subunit C/ Thiol specific antioxidant domain-containing protein n=1 Tax=Polarella glacialis TaxID=89957 RepID=A0A813DPX4_POLGL|nr:unnamed protein product [Polarella glacialis]|eukprot:CAMPEP_0115055666 /NCGR_PEP_ID=MMETSP0227-20121206/4774_1 /TAXON_ID=89957 /ORGANISM="Polarella glacialis, Strain CCMP 1383" /LENGTH=208 /DNA_ID=CAMNT_0002440273 /DNA_START=20 /DNA_END=646 /DNA_ORIENTATION=+